MSRKRARVDNDGDGDEEGGDAAGDLDDARQEAYASEQIERSLDVVRALVSRIDREAHDALQPWQHRRVAPLDARHGGATYLHRAMAHARAFPTESQQQRALQAIKVIWRVNEAWRQAGRAPVVTMNGTLPPWLHKFIDRVLVTLYPVETGGYTQLLRAPIRSSVKITLMDLSKRLGAPHDTPARVEAVAWSREQVDAVRRGDALPPPHWLRIKAREVRESFWVTRQECVPEIELDKCVHWWLGSEGAEEWWRDELLLRMSAECELVASIWREAQTRDDLVAAIEAACLARERDTNGQYAR